jgi:predicted DNA-binding transcriptional regulator AlpA
MPNPTASTRYSSDAMLANRGQIRLTLADAEVRSEARETYSTRNQEPLSQNTMETSVQGANTVSHRPDSVRTQTISNAERLLNARQVADRLGVSERWVRDHTTRRAPRIRGIKLGALVRYRHADVEIFMTELGTLPSSRHSRFGV